MGCRANFSNKKPSSAESHLQKQKTQYNQNIALGSDTQCPNQDYLSAGTYMIDKPLILSVDKHSPATTLIAHLMCNLTYQVKFAAFCEAVLPPPTIADHPQ